MIKNAAGEKKGLDDETESGKSDKESLLKKIARKTAKAILRQNKTTDTKGSY
jgi:hypothetical protein